MVIPHILLCLVHLDTYTAGRLTHCLSLRKDRCHQSRCIGLRFMTVVACFCFSLLFLLSLFFPLTVLFSLRLSLPRNLPILLSLFLFLHPVSPPVNQSIYSLSLCLSSHQSNLPLEVPVNPQLMKMGISPSPLPSPPPPLLIRGY